jgi:hypothetical protein
MTTVAVEGDGWKGTERFSILRRLGAGGMGVVYLAHDRESDRQVALKTLHTLNPGEILRLKNEFRALAGLSHPNLAQLHELVADGDRCFFTMEYVEGTDFFSYIHHDERALPSTPTATATDSASATAPTAALPTSVGFNETLPAGELPSSARVPASRAVAAFTLDEARLRAVLAQLVRAIHALHTGRMLHLDIKPSNVLVTGEGRVVVLDFGLVTHLETSRTRPSASQQHAGGTPAYMAPEQALAQGMCEASDWYGVGTMLFEVLTRTLPFQGSVLDVLRRKLNGEAPHPLAQNPLAPPALGELCFQMLQRGADARPSASAIASVLGVDLEREGILGVHERAAALIGREAHAQALREAFDDVRRGNVVRAFVHGPSGMGKTALVQAFLEELVSSNAALVLSGRCYERESVPYKAFDSLIDELYLHLAELRDAELEALLPPHVAALARLFPVLVQLPPVAAELRKAGAVQEAQELRRQGFAALRELLRRLALKRRTVLFIDDLQWGDLDSAALLGDLLRPPDAPPLMLLASYRSEEAATSPLLQKLLSKRGDEPEIGAFRDVAVGPLTFEQSRELALSTLDPADPDREAKAGSVAQEAAGHPYFVSELVRDLNASGAAAGSKVGVSLDETIQRHVARLPPEARSLLEVVAVAGRPLILLLAQKARRLGLAEGASQRTGGEERALAVLQGSHLIRSTGVRDQDRIEAFHDRVRETVVSKLAPERLKEVHGHLAVTLEASGQADPEELAFHFQGARVLEKAAHYGSLAAARAEEALAFDRAATFYRMALELRGPEAPAEVVQPLREKLAVALANAGRGAEAGNAYLEASKGAEGAGALELRRRAAEQLLISGHIDAGLEVIRSVLGEVGLALAPSPSYALASIVARRLYLRVRGLDFTPRKVSEIPEEVLRRIDICWSIAVGLGVVDNVRAADFQARHLVFALKAGEPERVARAVAFEIGFVAIPGSAADEISSKLVERARELAEQVDTPYSHSFYELMAGVRDYMAGRWVKAFALMDQAERVLRERCAGVNWEITSAQRFSLGCLYYLGDVPELTRRVHALLRRAEERGNLYAGADLRTRFTFIWLAADDPARAEREIEEALSKWSHGGFHLQHFNSLMALGQKDLYTGEVERAEARMKAQMPALKGSLLLRIQGLRVELANLQGRLALALATKAASPEASFRAAERAAAALEKERADWATPLGSLLRASVAAGRGDAAKAIATLDRCIIEMGVAGMELYAAAARWRKGELTGGIRGEAMIDEARAWMKAKEVRRPERMLGVLAPGPWTAVGR